MCTVSIVLLFNDFIDVVESTALGLKGSSMCFLLFKVLDVILRGVELGAIQRLVESWAFFFFL